MLGEKKKNTSGNATRDVVDPVACEKKMLRSRLGVEPVVCAKKIDKCCFVLFRFV